VVCLPTAPQVSNVSRFKTEEEKHVKNSSNLKRRNRHTMHSLRQMTVTFAGGLDCCRLGSLDDALVLETTKPFSDKLSTASALLLAAATTVSFCNNNNNN